MTSLRNSIIFITVFIIASFLYAHEDHDKKEKTPLYDTLTIVNGDTIAINGVPITGLKQKVIERGTKQFSNEKEAIDESSVRIEAIFEHIHNKVVHFPIALSFAGFLLMLFGYKDKKFLDALKIIIPVGAVIGVVAIISGQAQIGPFEGTNKIELVGIHQILGYAVVFLLILWSISLYFRRFYKISFILALITMLLVSVVGLYGGIIAH